MDMTALEQTVPYLTPHQDQPLHSVALSPYPQIGLRLPGKYWNATTPQGGDFVVRVTDAGLGWQQHPFKHTELFDDTQRVYEQSPQAAAQLVEAYFEVVAGADPEGFAHLPVLAGVLPPLTFLRAAQCLALAEQRRYARYESRGGGKWLPWRFSYGIAHGFWGAAQAAAVEKEGRPGVERLEGAQGMPAPLARLLKR